MGYSVADLVLGSLSIFWMIKGFWVGLSGELFSFAGMAAGVLAAFRGGPVLARFVLAQPWAPDLSEVILSFAFGLVFFALCNIAASFAARATRKGLKAANLGGLDRLMGAGVGCLKAALLVLFLYGGILLLSAKGLPPWVDQSRLLRLAGSAWPTTSRKLTEWKLLDLGEAAKFPIGEKH